MVKQNNGAILVYSHEGLGTTFKIFFPVEATAEMAAPAAKPVQEDMPPYEPTGETILVVEDEALVLSHLARLLRRKGYLVLTAVTAKEALEVVSKVAKPIDLILSDVVMPEMNGLELIERIRELAPLVPVLLMSGYPSDVITRQGTVDATVGFIEKPFHSDQIVQQIRKTLRASTAL